MDFLNDYIEAEPLKAVKDLPASNSVDTLLASALEVAQTSPVWVDEEVVEEVYYRELDERGEASALRETMNFISVWQNYKTQASTRHQDLLPVGHPQHPDAAYATREDVALYMATQIPGSVESSVVQAVMACIESIPGSIHREYHRAVVASVAPLLQHLVDDADAALSKPYEDYVDEPLPSFALLESYLPESEDEDDLEDEE